MPKSRPKQFFTFRLKFLLTLLIAVAAGVTANHTLPAQHLVWRKLNPDAPIGLATKVQLMRVSLSPSKSCLTLAEGSGNPIGTPAEPHRPGDVCGWDVALTHDVMSRVKLSPRNVTMQCPLTLGTYIWTREIDALAQKYFKTGLKKLHHAGTYSCRRQIGNGSGAWSEHAFANAFDVMAFELEDGQMISVLKDWGGTKNKRRFLREARDKACDIFRVTLSPDYNAAHADHFHFDMGPSATCR